MTTAEFAEKAMSSDGVAISNIFLFKMLRYEVITFGSGKQSLFIELDDGAVLLPVKQKDYEYYLNIAEMMSHPKFKYHFHFTKESVAWALEQWQLDHDMTMRQVRKVVPPLRENYVRVYSTEDPVWYTVEWDVIDTTTGNSLSYGTMCIPSKNGMDDPHLKVLSLQGFDIEDHRKEVYTKDGPKCRS